MLPNCCTVLPRVFLEIGQNNLRDFLGNLRIKNFGLHVVLVDHES